MTTTYIIPNPSNKYLPILANLEEILNGDLEMEDAFILRAKTMRAETLLNLIFAEDYILQEQKSDNGDQPAANIADRIPPELVRDPIQKSAVVNKAAVYQRTDDPPGFSENSLPDVLEVDPHENPPAGYHNCAGPDCDTWFKPRRKDQKFAPGHSKCRAKVQYRKDRSRDNGSAHGLKRGEFLIKSSGQVITRSELTSRLKDHDLDIGETIIDYRNIERNVVSGIGMRHSLYPEL